MTTRFTGSGTPRVGGMFGTHKQDFVAHHTGGDWRHSAIHIDVSAPLPWSNVQEALENLSDGLGGGLGAVLSIDNKADGHSIDLDNGSYIEST
ncbi:MAG: hypothetical protein WC942_01385, partial [Clostridia bacterium]